MVRRDTYSLKYGMSGIRSADMVSPDPDDLLAMLYTWQSGDVSAQEPYDGDFAAAMKGIKAKALVMPCRTDLYFP